MASVREAVKEQLLGSPESSQLSHQSRANFLRHAQKDENGELFMTKENFIDAVAPTQEDYVSVTRNTPKVPQLWSQLLTCFPPNSTRLSANNMVSSSTWQTDGEMAS
jgi:hypothetical protein